MRYILTTPKNPQFNGKRMGIAFVDGRAVVDDLSKPRGVDVSLKDLISQVRSDFPGIAVEEVPESAPAALKEKR
jgi:hypothetical protein